MHAHMHAMPKLNQNWRNLFWQIARHCLFFFFAITTQKPNLLSSQNIILQSNVGIKINQINRRLTQMLSV